MRTCTQTASCTCANSSCSGTLTQLAMLTHPCWELVAETNRPINKWWDWRGRPEVCYMARNTILTSTVWLEGIEVFSGAGWTLFLNIGHWDPVRKKKVLACLVFFFFFTVTMGGTTMSSSSAETSGDEGLRRILSRQKTKCIMLQSAVLITPLSFSNSPCGSKDKSRLPSLSGALQSEAWAIISHIRRLQFTSHHNKKMVAEAAWDSCRLFHRY